MGKTAFRGPAYGAKGGLFSFGPVVVANGSTALVTSIVVPPYETWYLTELFAANAVASSISATPAVVLKVDGTPTADSEFAAGNPGTVATLTGPASTAAGFNQMVTATVSPAGEYEGYAAPANSTIRIVSSGTVPALHVRVNGFIRYFNSTRAI